MESFVFFVLLKKLEKAVMKNSFLIVFSFFIIFSCNKSKSEPLDTPAQGTITMEADESFKSVVEALTERYMALNPSTKINVIYK